MYLPFGIVGGLRANNFADLSPTGSLIFVREEVKLGGNPLTICGLNGDDSVDLTAGETASGS